MQKKSYFKIDNRNQIMPILLMTKILQKVIFFVVGILSFVLGKVLNFCYSNSTSFCCRFMVVIMGVGLIFGLLNFAGCSHNAVNRGHIISLEYNRPPWIGCPPDTGCDVERTCKLGHSKSSCDCDEHSNNSSNNTGKRLRRFCGLKSSCTAKNPCCEVAGCGMWVDPSDPNSLAFNPRMPRACGLTPFCSPMRPCGMTPHCGRPSSPYLASQPQMPIMPQQGFSPYAGTGMNNLPTNWTLSNGLNLPTLNFPQLSTTSPSAVKVPSTLVSPTPNMITNPPTIPTTPTNPNNNGNTPKQTPPQPATVAGPNGILVSMGIVPGVSAVNGGGFVAANGVATQFGVMTPNGVQLQNGALNSQMVIRVCGSHAGCSPSRPCGMSGCGTIVPVSLVSNNAAPLAAELIARNNRSNRVVSAIDGNMNGGFANYNNYNGNGNVALVNGIAPQNARNIPNYIVGNNVNRGNINYPTASANNASLRSPPPLQPNLYDDEQDEYIEDENENLINENAATPQNKKSMMPLPRFHSVPTEPAFNRRRGIPVQKTLDENGNNNVSKNSNNPNDNAIERAYLEGVMAALEEVESELDSQDDEIENAKLKKLAMEKAEKLQAKIDAKAERDAEIAEFEAEQLRNAKILARRQAELEQKAQNLTIERNRLQDEEQLIATQKPRNINQKTNNSNIQPANYQQTKKENDNKENVFASAVNFLKGNPQKQNNKNLNQQNQNQNSAVNIAQNNPQQKSHTRQSQNLNQQTGSVNRFLSPITNIISSTTKPKPLPQSAQKSKPKKIINNEEIDEPDLPTRPATFPNKAKRQVNS